MSYRKPNRTVFQFSLRWVFCSVAIIAIAALIESRYWIARRSLGIIRQDNIVAVCPSDTAGPSPLPAAMEAGTLELRELIAEAKFLEIYSVKQRPSQPVSLGESTFVWIDLVSGGGQTRKRLVEPQPFPSAFPGSAPHNFVAARANQSLGIAFEAANGVVFIEVQVDGSNALYLVPARFPDGSYGHLIETLQVSKVSKTTTDMSLKALHLAGGKWEAIFVSKRDQNMVTRVVVGEQCRF